MLLLLVVGRPVATDDLWFHLKMGEVYGTETLWPEADPMLHTAGDRRPVQHEWLFGVAVFALERAIGLQGLRLVHVIAVSGIVLLVFASFRRESGAALPAVSGDLHLPRTLLAAALSAPARSRLDSRGDRDLPPAPRIPGGAIVEAGGDSPRA